MNMVESPNVRIKEKRKREVGWSWFGFKALFKNRESDSRSRLLYWFGRWWAPNLLRGFYIENPVCPSNGKGLFIRKKAHDFILVSILRSTLGEDPNKCIILCTSQLAAFLNKVNSFSMMLKEYHIYLQKSTQAFYNHEEEQPKKSKYKQVIHKFSSRKS
jgi:hypothetical protein